MDLKKELIELRTNMLKIDSLIMVSNRPMDANHIAMNCLNTIAKLIESEERKEKQIETTATALSHGVSGTMLCPKCSTELHSSGQCIYQMCSGYSRRIGR